MSLRKRFRAGLLIAGCSVLLTGCWDSVEINDLAMVMGSGFDLTEDGLVEATVQIANPAGFITSTSGGSKDKKPYIVVSQKGKDSIDVIRKMQTMLSRRFSLSHRSIIVFSEAYAKHGIDQFLDQLLRSPDSRYSSYVLTARGSTAKEIIEQPYELESIPVLGLRKMQKEQRIPSVRLDRFMDSLATPTATTFTGVIRADRGKEESGKLYRIDQTAIYEENKLIGYLNEDETTLYLWAMNSLKQTMMTVQFQPETAKFKGTVSLNIMKAKTKILTAIMDGSPHAVISMKADAIVLSNDSSIDLSMDKNIKKVEGKFEESIHNQFMQLIRRSQEELIEDIFDIDEHLHIQHPYIWKSMKDTWESRYRHIPIVVNVDVEIKRTGRTQAPAHLHKKDCCR